MQFLHNYLKDPLSAVCDWNPIYRGATKDGLLDGHKSHFGYVLDGKVNAKNSFGGYIGYKPYKFVFHNGVIDAIYTEQLIGSTAYLGKIY